jgi:hypothetical protein
MPNAHNRQKNGAGGAPADHFARSRRRIENNEMTFDTIAGSLLRIFVRMEKLDASLGQLSRRMSDLRKSEHGIGHALFERTADGTRGQLLTGSYIPVIHIHIAPGEPSPAHLLLLPLCASRWRSSARAAAAAEPLRGQNQAISPYPRVTLPRVQPIIPTWRKEPFDDPDWLLDFKYDGFRALCYIKQGRGRAMLGGGTGAESGRAVRRDWLASRA